VWKAVPNIACDCVWKAVPNIAYDCVEKAVPDSYDYMWKAVPNIVMIVCRKLFLTPAVTRRRKGVALAWPSK
jgi:hypothetical protein